MARKKVRNYYRIVFQWIVLLLLAYLVIRPYIDRAYKADFEAYCPFGGLQALSSFLANNSLACSMTTTQIAMGLALLLGIFAFSKLFCSYLCPIGTFTEWLGRIGRRFKLNFTPKGLTDRLLRVFKYALLFVVFYFSVSSSELFCKTFDPYYAVFSGFGSDVNLTYALIGLVLVIPGSFFIRQFWCRYFCPLSAASNVFAYIYVFAGLIALFLLLTMLAGLAISWIWLLAALSIAGAVLESTTLKSTFIPLIKVTRNSETCTNCRICDKACPMAIRISDQPSVQHIDCHLCGDCTTRCPEKDTLQFNKRNLNWLPSVAVFALVAGGLLFASFTDIPTVNIRWGTAEQMAAASVYEQGGLPSIKCFGSSMSFVNHMKEVQGVLGAETFVGDHKVRVFFDSAQINREQIRQAIFSPVSRIIDVPPANVTTVAVAEAGIDHFFDPKDAAMLSIRLSQADGIYALQTRFGEPVHALVYYNPVVINIDNITKLIEAPEVRWESDGALNVVETDFKVASIGQAETLETSGFFSRFYEMVEMSFNNYDSYQPSELDTLNLGFREASLPDNEGMAWYLLSHVSNNKGIVQFSTPFTNHGIMLQLVYVKAKTSPAQIISLLDEPQLNVFMSDGTQQQIPNPFHLDP